MYREDQEKFKFICLTVCHNVGLIDRPSTRSYIEQMVKCELRDAERVYVNDILQNGLESWNNKPYWKYGFGISALKSNGNVITDSLSKAEILKSQFKFVFTPQSGNTFPQLPGTQFSKIKTLHISENGVFMVLDMIDVSKSFGPDKLPGRLLQSLAREILIEYSTGPF